MNRRGFIDFEWATVFLIIVMFIATGYSIYRLWTPAVPAETTNLWLDACQETLEKMGADLKYARDVTVSSSTLVITGSQGAITTWTLVADALRRTQGSEETVLMKGLQTGLFCSDPGLPGFVSVLLLHGDKSALPFFTSFAARGMKQP